MTVQYSVAVRNAMLDAIETATGTAPKLRILTGAQPANCAAAQTGTLLVEITLPSDWLAAASSGTKDKLGTWSATATGTGTAAHYRIVDTAGTTCHEQGNISTSGADINLDSTTINTGQTVTISTKTITAGNA